MHPMMMAAGPDNRQSGYSLNAQYAHVNEKNPQEPKLIVFANMQSSGRLQTVFAYNIRKWLHFRLNYFFPNSDMSMCQRSMEVDIDAKNAAHNITVDNHVMSYNLVKSIGKNLDLGFELFYVQERNLMDLNYVGKYTMGNHTFYGDYSAAMKT